MNKTPIFLLLLIGLFSCNNPFFDVSGNGNIVIEERDVEDFTRLDFHGAYHVVITEGTQPSLEIEADENLMEYITSKVQGNTLRIENSARLMSEHGIVIKITYTDIEQIEVHGAGNLENFGTIATQDLKVSLSGAGNIDLRVDVTDLEVSTSGAGNMTLNGECQSAKLDLSGAGGVDAYGLTSSNCRVRVSGVGGAEVYVTEELDAKVSGIGSISYKGNPQRVQSDVSGIGSIENEGE